MLIGGSIALAVGTFVSMFWLGRQYRIGWLIGLATQAVAIPYDVITNQYGMLALAVALSVIYTRSWYRWQEPITQDRLEEAAYFRWLARGCPHGDDESDWLAAHTELSTKGM